MGVTIVNIILTILVIVVSIYVGYVVISWLKANDDDPRKSRIYHYSSVIGSSRLGAVLLTDRLPPSCGEPVVVDDTWYD